MTGACGNAVHTAKPHASPVRQGCSEQRRDGRPAPRQPSPQPSPAIGRGSTRPRFTRTSPPEGPHPLTRGGRPHPSERCFGFAQHDNLRAPSQPLVRCPRTLDSRLRGNDGHGRQVPIRRGSRPSPSREGADHTPVRDASASLSMTTSAHPRSPLCAAHARWIPACAGMTGMVRGNDGHGARE